MSVTALCLGLDVSPLRMGWALVRLDDGSPVACGCEALDLPAHGWSHATVTTACRRVQDVATWDSSDPRGEVSLVYIEQPWLSPKSGTKSAYSAGRAVQAVQGEVERRWPHAPVQWLAPSEWRKAAGLSGNATKLEVSGFAGSRGFTHGGSQDAADAAVIALAGWHINEQIGAHVTAGGRVL